MRTWRIHELGEPIDNLLLEDVQRPEPGAGEVLLDVSAVGLAFPDVLQCRGQYQFKPPLPFTPGGETAGTVVAVGEGVDGFEPEKKKKKKRKKKKKKKKREKKKRKKKIKKKKK